MAFTHGKTTFVSLNAVDLSAFTNTSEFGRTYDDHDVTAYGKQDHVYQGGLGDGKFTMAGIYDDTTAGPRDTIEPLLGTVVALVRRPEGTGAGKPQDTVNVLVKSYVETNPVAGMVAWSAELQPSDAVVSINQV